MLGFLLVLCGLSMAHAGADPLSCLACLGGQAACYANTCKGVCGANLSATECVSCVAAAGATCGSSGSACSIGCSIDDITDNIMSFKTLLTTAAKSNSSDSSHRGFMVTPGTTRSAACYESQDLMKTCGTQCYSNADRAQCSATCLEGKGVAAFCASCMGKKIQCTVGNCLDFCAGDANSRACRSCVSRTCGSCNSVKSSEEPETSFALALAAVAGSAAQSVFP